MPHKPSDLQAPSDHEKDPVWDLLGKASETTPSQRFAKDVVRATRQLPVKLSLGARIQQFAASFSSTQKFATTAVAACACVLLVLQVTQNNDNTVVEAPDTSHVQELVENTEPLEISEFIFQETLIAAAEDPTIFSHDEVLAMVGF